ncbi:hypothetical protein AQUCO_00100878v1 [Aquilegia coerulea]|uniref:Reverse transcriptase zinc-binding domain-containing protein n=1 Tax=Aquilegia coerulea TaxID=218851 RepID=A0A2G5FCF4_AQUCA|nr:hypothetical protein AQUCO_00100878v1 [Aquilegia coerulea]
MKYFTKSGDMIQYYKHSSRWNGLKSAILEVKPRMRWIIGNGKKVDLWRDNWLGSSIQDILHLSPSQLRVARPKLVH